ncbi:MAG: L,D-transpeptidase [Thermanaeromonas sp.]|nr:L,D-transpeptidase [Thermanaeromonas sp.]MCG0277680.1 L,D-transpeptidase [Thermanaeromonas sp.]
MKWQSFFVLLLFILVGLGAFLSLSFSPPANDGIAGQPGTAAKNEEPEGGKGAGLFVPPEKGYWIEVRVADQKVRIYKDGQLEKEWLASTGTADKGCIPLPQPAHGP